MIYQSQNYTIFPIPQKKEADCWAKGSQKHDFFVKLLEFTRFSLTFAPDFAISGKDMQPAYIASSVNIFNIRIEKWT